MAKRITKDNNELVLKDWKEAELIEHFGLVRLVGTQTPVLMEWLNVFPLDFNVNEQYLFDKILSRAQKSISSWSEEDLKMKFIGAVLELGHLEDDDNMIGYFDKIISAVVNDTKLSVKSDFMLAKGFLNIVKKPYFHFQEYKPQINPKGEPMAQLLQAFLIAQEKNKDNMPIYGAEVFGAQWRFVVLEEKNYCISRGFDAIDRHDLLTIIAILRNLKAILKAKFS
jgi:hypothetical protein